MYDMKFTIISIRNNIHLREMRLMSFPYTSKASVMPLLYNLYTSAFHLAAYTIFS